MGIQKKAVEKYEGKVVSFTCTSDVTVGDIIPLGAEMVGIAVVSGLVGEEITIEIEKVWTVTAATAGAITIGQTMYWDNTAKVMTTVSTSNTKAGKALSIKAAATAGTVDVKINR